MTIGPPRGVVNCQYSIGSRASIECLRDQLEWLAAYRLSRLSVLVPTYGTLSSSATVPKRRSSWVVNERLLVAPLIVASHLGSRLAIGTVTVSDDPFTGPAVHALRRALVAAGVVKGGA